MLSLAHRIRGLGLYLTGLTLTYLAAAYLGGFFVTLGVALLLLPLVSLGLLLVTFHNLRYHQNFSTERPVKGDVVVYSFSIENDSIIPVPEIRVRFKVVHPSGDLRLPDNGGHLRGAATLRQEHSIKLPYRGIYTVGFDVIELYDALRLFKIRPEVHYRTFHVYPRVVPLRRFLQADHEHPQSGESESDWGGPDYALFKQLGNYRSGESVRHMAWRRFAATGLPVVKQYQASSEPSVRIYLDVRPVADGRSEPLATEDVSVEVTVALVNHFLSARVPTRVRSNPAKMDFQGTSPKDFDRFYRSTFDLMFDQTASPATIYRADQRAAGSEQDAVILITHRDDPRILEILESSLGQRQRVTLVFNATGDRAPSQRVARRERYFADLLDRGANLVVVTSSQTLGRDLAGD